MGIVFPFKACSTLRTYALQPENGHLMAKSLVKVLQTLEPGLRDRVSEMRNAVSRTIGCIGAAVIVRPEGHAFIAWTLQNLDSAGKDIKGPLLFAIKEVFPSWHRCHSSLMIMHTFSS